MEVGVVGFVGVVGCCWRGWRVGVEWRGVGGGCGSWRFGEKVWKVGVDFG